MTTSGSSLRGARAELFREPSAQRRLSPGGRARADGVSALPRVRAEFASAGRGTAVERGGPAGIPQARWPGLRQNPCEPRVAGVPMVAVEPSRAMRSHCVKKSSGSLGEACSWGSSGWGRTTTALRAFLAVLRLLEAYAIRLLPPRGRCGGSWAWSGRSGSGTLRPEDRRPDRHRPQVKEEQRRAGRRPCARVPVAGQESVPAPCRGRPGHGRSGGGRFR